MADEFHFNNVLYNIVDNALKYCSESPEIVIKSVETDKGITLHFSDNGSGIAPQHIDYVFDKFYRVPRENKKDIEGWGMTHDEKFIYQTDGTEKIWKMDPTTLEMIDYINVYSGNAKIKSINELEWINGLIYSNVWQKDAIAVVNPISGAVEGILDLSGLRKFVKNSTAEVLNGIAYNPKTKTIFVTGKNWDKMFEIKVSD